MAKEHNISPLPWSTIDAESRVYSCVTKLTLADKWADVSRRMTVENGIAKLETAISLKTSTDECLTVLFCNIDALFKHYGRLK